MRALVAARRVKMEASRDGSGGVSGGSIHIVRSIVPHRSILAVALWMSGALLAFSASAIAVRALAPAFSIPFFMNLLQLPMNLADVRLAFWLEAQSSHALPLIALVGRQFYGEPLDPCVFLGNVCIIVGLLYSLHREARSA